MNAVMDACTVLIAGGGAAGLFAAALLAEEDPALDVLVVERGPRPMEKLRRTGGGRCNLTHREEDLRAFAAHYPRGARELLGPLHRFGPAETRSWFEAHGVPLVAEPDGRVFPGSNQAEDVAQALSAAAARGRVEVRTGVAVRSARPAGDGFEAVLADGGRVSCRRLLAATGGGSFLEGLDHAIEPCVPSLFGLRVPDPEWTALSGVSAERVRVRAPGFEADGGLLVTREGVSGPAILRLSSFGARRMADAGYRFELTVDWTAGASESETEAVLEEARRREARRAMGSTPPYGLPRRLWQLILARAGADPAVAWGHCPAGHRRAVVGQLRSFALPAAGRTPQAEFVTCGGIRRADVDFRTMESRRHPGLHFAGETLDVDGLTGGFNLQAAWTTGALAARAIRAGLRAPPADGADSA